MNRLTGLALLVLAMSLSPAFATEPPSLTERLAGAKYVVASYASILWDGGSIIVTFKDRDQAEAFSLVFNRAKTRKPETKPPTIGIIDPLKDLRHDDPIIPGSELETTLLALLRRSKAPGETKNVEASIELLTNRPQTKNDIRSTAFSFKPFGSG